MGAMTIQRGPIVDRIHRKALERIKQFCERGEYDRARKLENCLGQLDEVLGDIESWRQGRNMGILLDPE